MEATRRRIQKGNGGSKSTHQLFHPFLPIWRMCCSMPLAIIVAVVMGDGMSIAVHGQWETLSSQFAEVAAHGDKFVVAVHGGRRVAGSGIAWRKGVVVTASHMLRRIDDVEVTFADKS